MPEVCLYFQIHQPFRLRKYTVFDTDPSYFDNALNARIAKRVADRCYLPLTQTLLDLVNQTHGRFRFAVSITGTAIEQLETHSPEVLHNLHALADTGHVEFLGETYYHSLTSLYSRDEFAEQVAAHRLMLKRVFNQSPSTFRNTELVYSDDIAKLAAEMGFTGILAEGWEPVLNNRSSAFMYRAHTVGGAPVSLLLRNHHLSDAIAFHFNDPASTDFPLTDEKFAHLVEQIGGQLCNLFMDAETFGEHHSPDTGIMEFLRAFPLRLLHHHIDFKLPREIIERGEIAGELDVPHPISWADEARDLGAWAGNAMQKDALDSLYTLERTLKGHANPKLLADWRKLTTSDHAYYMSTKHANDGQVHAHFRPYDSPYDAYINFMNVLDNLRARAG
ncbi:MAG TPA: glycoside hydrolase family 57 protein [Phycisphaerae bacterium]|nr:glycoside hydrolase family 57 protein [Phycisphaerae bacterium]